MPNRCIFGVTLSGLEHAYYYFAGVDANATLNWAPAVAYQLGRIPAQILLHSECGIERTLWMVFVGNRRAEQRENAVAGGLHDVSVVAIDGFNPQLQSWIDDCPGLLGIEVLHQLGGAFDVGAERGYRLAFAFGNRGICRFGYDRNLSPAQRGPWRLGGSTTGHQHCPAITAEAFAWRVVRTAFWAKVRK